MIDLISLNGLRQITFQSNNTYGIQADFPAAENKKPVKCDQH